MKTMTCEQLGGACSLEFSAETFEEISELSKNHGMEMYKKGDKEHLAAMAEMQKLMQSSNDIQEWLEIKKKAFEDLPED